MSKYAKFNTPEPEWTPTWQYVLAWCAGGAVFGILLGGLILAYWAAQC